LVHNHVCTVNVTWAW